MIWNSWLHSKRSIWTSGMQPTILWPIFSFVFSRISLVYFTCNVLCPLNMYENMVLVKVSFFSSIMRKNTAPLKILKSLLFDHPYCTMYNAICTMYNVQRTMYNVQCTMYNAQCKMYNAQCRMYNAQCSIIILYLNCL